jgi:AmmeMemoRadiSam system protein B/AmmeMemoRadiSam system protein A
VAPLKAELWRLLRGASGAPVFRTKPIALVAPHAGWPYSGPVAAAAFHTLRPGDFRRVVIVAPSHYGDFDAFGTDDASAYRTPLGAVPVCADARGALLDAGAVRLVEGVSAREHAVEIELPFLQKTLGAFCFVPILAGRTSADAEKALAEGLATLNDGQTLFVFSSDFTHYGARFGYTPFGTPASAAREKIRALDQRAIGLLMRADAAGFRAYLAETKNTICGRAGLGAMLELLARIAPQAKATLLGTYASADIPAARDDGSVSYVAIAYTREGPTSGKPIMEPPAQRDVTEDSPPLTDAAGARLVRLARAALVTQLAGGGDLDRELETFRADPEFDRRQGVFVTLNRTDPAEIRVEGKLRGCVGQVLPTYPIYQAVVEAAVAAAVHDGRFEPVTAAELDRLELEVTVLSVPRPVPSWKEIRLGTHGIVLEKDRRRALFLPQVAPEQGWNIEQTLSALSRKAGLPPDAWREGATFSVFTGQVFEEHAVAKKRGSKDSREVGG